MQATKLLSEMRASLRFLILFSLCGVIVAALTFYNHAQSQQQIEKLQTSTQSAYRAFDRRMLHGDLELDLILHRLKDSPSAENLVECQQLLLERATDPNSAQDQMAWTWFVSVISKHAEIHGTESEIWDWFNTDVINEANNIMSADGVRRASICVLREQDMEVPGWMLMNEADAELAANIVPLKLRSPAKAFAEVDTESGYPTGDDQ